MEWIKAYVNKSNSGCDNTGPILSFEVESLEFGIYPNPVKRGSKIKIVSTQDDKSIHIVSKDGRVVFAKKLGDSVSDIKIDLQEGLYIIEAHKKDGRKLYKKLLVR